MSDQNDNTDGGYGDGSPGIVRYRDNGVDDAPFFDHPEEAEEVGGGIYTCPQTEGLETADQHGIITVLDWNWDGQGNPLYKDLDAPPELIRREPDPDDDDEDETQLLVAAAKLDGSAITSIDFSEWMCVRCGNITETEPVYVGGEVTEPSECINCEREGPFNPAGVPRGTDPETVYDTMLTDPVWAPPPGFRDDLETLQMGTLFDTVRDHISTHWKSGGRDWLYDGLAAYALSSWFREAFDFVPHLLVFGPKETGKTRLYNTLSTVCYRARHVVSSSPAFLYRSVSEYDISLFVSEFHRMDEETRMTAEAIINAGQKRGEAIGRTDESSGGGFDPVVFDPFTHFGISSQRKPADDLLSRCFVIQAQQATGSVPRTIADASSLQRDLLTARFRYLRSEELDDALEATRERMDKDRLYGRLSEKLYALVAMAELCNRDISEFVANVTESDRELESDSIDAIVTQAVIDVALEMISEGKQQTFDGDPWAGLRIPYDRVIEQLMEMTGEEMSPQMFGTIRDRLNLEKKRLNDGTYISDPDLLEKLQRLSEQYHLDMPIEEAEESQEQRRERVYEAICNHADEDEPANIEEVLEHLELENLDEEAAAHDIQKLLQEGRVYRQDGGIRPT